MAQAVSGARLTVAVGFQFLFVENGVEQFALPFGEEKVGGFRQASSFIGSSPSRVRRSAKDAVDSSGVRTA